VNGLRFKVSTAQTALLFFLHYFRRSVAHTSSPWVCEYSCATIFTTILQHCVPFHPQ
jgi:hypothetical protein